MGAKGGKMKTKEGGEVRGGRGKEGRVAVQAGVDSSGETKAGSGPVSQVRDFKTGPDPVFSSN
jgi:hypothetical protein